MELIDEDMVKRWSLRFSNVGLVLLGAGPPCQGVSGLNADRRGALRDLRSCLFQHVPRFMVFVNGFSVGHKFIDLLRMLLQWILMTARL